MLEDLVHVIETLKQRIREHGALLRENETRTRMALIDPLLALCWGGTRVRPGGGNAGEYNVSGRWSRLCAACEPTDKPAATVEAKTTW